MDYQDRWNAKETQKSVKPKLLDVHVIAGRHIFGLGRTYQSLNTSNVDYSIEIIGVDVDKLKHRFRVREEIFEQFLCCYQKFQLAEPSSPDLDSVLALI